MRIQFQKLVHIIFFFFISAIFGALKAGFLFLFPGQIFFRQTACLFFIAGSFFWSILAYGEKTDVHKKKKEPNRKEKIQDKKKLTIHLKPLGVFRHGEFAKRAAENVVYDPKNQLLFVTNYQKKSLDVLKIRNPEKPALYKRIPLETYGIPTAIALHGNLIGVTLLDKDKRSGQGSVAFLTLQTLEVEKVVSVGASPYAIQISRDGQTAIIVNQGEPDEFLTTDPEGSISLLPLRQILANISKQGKTTGSLTGLKPEGEALQKSIDTIGFSAFKNTPIKGANFSFPGASFAEAVQPETLTLYPEQNKALVSLQANNALAVIDLTQRKVTEIIGLGYKDWSQQKIDVSDRDKKINLRSWPLYSLYQPDGIGVYKGKNGKVYWVTANEGKAHSYKGYNEGERVHNLMLDYKAFPKSSNLQAFENLGRLKVNVALGDEDADGDYDSLYTFGARSFSIWSETGALLWDSGSLIETFLAKRHGRHGFNASHEENTFDQRSDDKGAEPENLVLATLEQRTYAFIGLERDSGIIIFDITNPEEAVLVGYGSTRDFSRPPTEGQQDLGVEGLLYISPEESPNQKPLLVTCNEVSGTTRLYEIILNTMP